MSRVPCRAVGPPGLLDLRQAISKVRITVKVYGPLHALHQPPAKDACEAMKGLLVAAVAATLAWTTDATASAGDDVRVIGPQITASVDAGLQYWKSLGRTPGCPKGIVVYLADLGTTASGLHAAGRAHPTGCRVDLDRSWIATLTEPLPLCQLMVHEIGHLVGLGDGGTGNPVMDAPSLEDLPPLAPCLAAFPPPAPAAAAGPPPTPPIITAPAPAHQMTLKALRAEAARTMRASRERARPVSCKLSGRRRGTCRAARAGRRCRGRIYVTLSDSDGVSGVSDIECSRKR